jgi:hypothetical protein
MRWSAADRRIAEPYAAGMSDAAIYNGKTRAGGTHAFFSCAAIPEGNLPPTRRPDDVARAGVEGSRDRADRHGTRIAVVFALGGRK